MRRRQESRRIDPFPGFVVVIILLFLFRSRRGCLVIERIVDDKLATEERREIPYCVVPGREDEIC